MNVAILPPLNLTPCKLWSGGAHGLRHGRRVPFVPFMIVASFLALLILPFSAAGGMFVVAATGLKGLTVLSALPLICFLVILRERKKNGRKKI